ncbi:unnamed protein product [Fructobacillus fructosus]|uniref:hypothetical protein n=1 Tax=Fructobacillus fructosus TaxID=1631 RepID=UPI0002195253|nr:hypothetical protein [Fructobacillus fructosus]GAP01315.1 hypothetical protein FFRU_060400 [Fructobacillus fructosus]CAK1244633.1 unnamed protein product [Fructobacillus fructosus]
MTKQQVLACKIIMIMGIIVELIWLVIDLALGRLTEMTVPSSLLVSQSMLFWIIFWN